MKNKFTKAITSIIVVMMLVLTAIPFVSAASLLDESKKVSISLNCNKPGYTFEVFKVASLDSTSTTPYETKYTALVSGIETAINSGKTADILKALDGMSTLPTSAVSQGSWTTSTSSTSKTYANLEQGIYYIKATNYPAGVKAVTNSVVALPYFSSNNSWVYSVPAINLANKVIEDTPVTHKTITNSTKNNENYTDVSLGDTVNFEIKSTVGGSSAMKLGSYTVYDDMSKGLTLDKNSFNVALLNASGTKITDLDKSEYTVNVTSEGDGENTKFNVALTNAYLQTEEFYASDVVYTSVTYSAVLNKHAVVGTAGNPNTEEKLEYSNKNGVKSEVEGNTVYVYTYAAMTNKTDPDGKPLSGAEFKLYATEANAKAHTSELATGVSDSEGKVLYYNSNDEEMKLASGDYYIVETKAPVGYSPYGKVIKISIDATYGDTLVNGTYVTNSPENGYASVDVPNYPITTPKTGGIGTSIFYIAGSALLIGSGIFFFIARKKKSRNTK